MLAYCVLSRTSLQFTRREHGFMLLQGVFFASLNYYFFYLSSQYLLSGLISLVFANFIIMNAFISRLILKHPLTKQVVGGGLVGLAGLVLAIGSEISHMKNAHVLFDVHLLMGVGLCLIAVVWSSLGTVLATYNRSHNKLPILQTNAISLAYGTLCSLTIALFTHAPPHLDLSWDYLAALFYLAIPGTVVGFVVYTLLLDRIGPARVGYVFVTTPVVSLALSTLFENFHWTAATFLGVFLALLGNVIVMRKPKTFPKAAAA